MTRKHLGLLWILEKELRLIDPIVEEPLKEPLFISSVFHELTEKPFHDPLHLLHVRFVA